MKDQRKAKKQLIDELTGLKQRVSEWEELEKERKQLEERPREYEMVIENSPNMIAAVDKDYKFVLANSRYLKYRCLKRDQVIGRLARDVVGEDVFERVIKKNLDACFRGEVIQYEMKHIYPELGERDLLIRYLPMEHPGGVNRVVSIIQDITDRKHKENEILLQHALAVRLSATSDLNEALKLCLETAIKASKMDCGGVYLVDKNSGGLDLKCSIALSDEFVNAVSQYDKDSANTHLVMEGKPIYRHHPNLELPLSQIKLLEGLSSIAIIPICHEKQVIGCINVASRKFIDVPVFARSALETIAAQVGSAIVRIKAEGKIKELTQFFETVIDNANIWIDVVDKNANVLIWNKAAEMISGYSSQEVIGRDRVWEWLYPENSDYKNLKTGVIQSMERGDEKREIENMIRTKAGERRIIGWYSRNLLDDQGAPVGSVVLGQDVTERKRGEEEREKLIEQLRRAREQLQELSRRLIDLQETERREITRELHDQVGQNLTALGINLNIIRNLLPRPIGQKLNSRIDDSQRLVEETTAHIRDLMARLRPPVLDDYGLVAALNWYKSQFRDRTGIAIIMKEKKMAHRLPLIVEIALFRITQEALTNVAKHARASRVTITIQEQSKGFRLVITDNGKGFDSEVHHRPGARPQWGLINMRERAESFGGQFRIQTAPGKGTKIIVEVPRKH